MKSDMHFLFSGGEFGYPYYLALASALKVHPERVILHLLEEPPGEYYQCISKHPKLMVVEDSIDRSLPVFQKEFYHHSPDSWVGQRMASRWKNVVACDYTMARIMAESGGIMKGLDSFTAKSYLHLVPEDKEALIPNWGPTDEHAIMDGAFFKQGSAIAQHIYQDSDAVVHGHPITGKHHAWEGDKYRWGGAGIIPFLNRIIEGKERVAFFDIRDYAITWYGSSSWVFGALDEFFVHNNRTSKIDDRLIGEYVRNVLTLEEYDPFGKIKEGA